MWRQLRQPAEAKSGMCMAVQLFSAPAGVRTYRRMRERAGSPEAPALHAAVGYEDGSVAVWDVSQPQAPIMSMQLHTEPVMALAIEAAGTGRQPLSAFFTVNTAGVGCAACKCLHWWP